MVEIVDLAMRAVIDSLKKNSILISLCPKFYFWGSETKWNRKNLNIIIIIEGSSGRRKSCFQ